MSSRPASPLISTTENRSSRSSSLEFRPEIEGLRALAIFLVLAAHAKVPYLEGGFIGVDVFFVLSGFLITRLLVDERIETGSIRMTAFYARRMRRLLPGLFVVLMVSAGASALLLAPADQIFQADLGTMSVLWLSNIELALSGQSYFADTAESNIFTHTWSLGVEEQFYLFWPMLILVACHRLKHAVAGVVGPQVNAYLVILGASSFLLSMYLSEVDPTSAYYLPFTRAWQFAAGAAAALWCAPWSSGGSQRLARTSTIALGWGGIAGILIGAIGFDRNIAYPGLWALLPTLATVALLISGFSTFSSLPQRILAGRFMGFFGRLSYGWYLWHWPVLVLGASLSGPLDGPITLLLLGVAALFAYASLKLVEKPIRSSPTLYRRPTITLAVAVLVMGLTVAAFMAWHAQAIAWSKNPQFSVFTAARADVPDIYRDNCDSWVNSSTLQPCSYGGTAAERTLVLIADSIGAQWFPALANLAQSPRWRVVVLTKSACPIVDQPVYYSRIGGARYHVCEEWRAAAIKYIQELDPDLVIIGSSRTYGFSDSEWESGSRRILTKLTGVGAIRIIHGTPSLPTHGPNCLARRAWQQHLGIGWVENACIWRVWDERKAESIAALQRAVSGIENARVVDVDQLVCPGSICRAREGSALVFRDEQHVTASFVSAKTAAFGSLIDFTF